MLVAEKHRLMVSGTGQHLVVLRYCDLADHLRQSSLRFHHRDRGWLAKGHRMLVLWSSDIQMGWETMPNAAWVSRVATKRPLSLSRDSQEASVRHNAAIRGSRPVVNPNWSGDYWMAPHLLKMRASYTFPGLEDIVNPLLPCFNFFYIVGIFKKSGDECTL